MKFYDTPEKRKWVKIIGILASLGGALTTANLVFGTEIRPAWAWEVENARLVSEAQYNELKTNQLRIHFDVLDTRRTGLNRDLTSFQVEAEKFRRAGESVPEWLLQSISDIEDKIRRLEIEQERIQNQLTSYLKERS